MNGINFFIIGGSISIISVTAILIWMKNKRIDEEEREKKVKEELYKKVLSSPKTSWKKIGTVKELFYYPLKSGKGNKVNGCNFEERGISINQDGCFRLRDRMFIVYDESTKNFQTGRQFPKLLLINIIPLNENQAKLEISDSKVEPLIFDLPKINKNSKITKCSVWYGESVECIDCGDKASLWLSSLLAGNEKKLRLGFQVKDYGRIVVSGNGKRTYENLRNEDTGIFSDLASYMILSESSVQDLNEKLEKPITPIQLRPNVVISDTEPFVEDEWDWIKIGENAILRNFKLCTRCVMVNIDPNSGTFAKDSEPLKTLKTYRMLKNPEINPREKHCPTIGIYCGLYSTGEVKTGDDVYVFEEP